MKVIKIDNIEVLDHIWFRDLGIVKGRDTVTGELKFYIGTCLGFTTKEDIRYIVQMGTKYTKASFKRLLKWLETEEN